ncbi:hypothetical protein LTR10_019764 [Elasticomyces elasticus]|uniref:Zn(2)-C6 fungal-type domain-containing protein n=1 Tax=Exophiala sideris TaxID=1016849 RepID=A0ABR0JCI2_9EURO|nr:hypothetical protein LTR10_019764 [Elasticomyces elasticus]KAK5032109.1 hypothetical protein LTS07_004731 [Exophiala sideris]KAK5041036.1 hypothetical protein LTR13_003338 [Exophiala sideris]KAK5061630.1 hypothetical protein LTR69_004812 [Exophiala sideris]KAK5184329.1 hypothetical protein LTR44_003002 [Eurotiomycetes sp. CCFEE 6388]
MRRTWRGTPMIPRPSSLKVTLPGKFLLATWDAATSLFLSESKAQELHPLRCDSVMSAANLSIDTVTLESRCPDSSAPTDGNIGRSKRQRVTRACLPCRKSKLKCDGAKPQCAACLMAKRPCSYAAAPRRRGLKTGYVRALECLWALVFENVANSEITVENLAKNAFQNGFRLRDDDDTNNVEYSIRRLLEVWRSSRVQILIDDALDESDNSDDETVKITRRTGSTTTLDLNTAGWSLPSELNLEEVSTTLGGPPPQVPEKMSTKVSEGPKSNLCWLCEGIGEVIDVTSMPKPPNSSRELLDSFFSYTQSWLPIVERHAVFRTFYTLNKKSSSGSKQDAYSGDHALLWAILSYTSLRQLESYDSQTSQKEITNCESMYRTSRSLIPWSNPGRIDISHVQALLFLALYRYTTGEYVVASRLVGEAIILARELGVGQHQSQGSDISKRIWLGCFTMETMISAQRKKPPLLRKSDVQYCYPLDDTGMDEWEPWRGGGTLSSDNSGAIPATDKPTYALSTFNLLIRILCITNAELHADSKQPESATLQYLSDWEGDVQSHHTSNSFPDGQPPLDSIPTNFLNLSILYIYLINSGLDRPQQQQQHAVGVNTQKRGQLCGLNLHSLSALMHSVNDTSLLPPSCQLLRINLSGPYATKTSSAADSGECPRPRTSHTDRHGVLGNNDAHQSLKSQPQSIQQAGPDLNPSLKNQGELMTYPPNVDFGMLYDENAIQDAPRVPHTEYAQVLNPSNNNGSSQNPLSVFTNEELSWPAPDEATQSRRPVPPLQSQWTMGAAASDSRDIPAEGGFATNPGIEPALPDLLDNEEWLTHYFDGIEDFERNDQEQFRRSLGYSV